MSLVNIIKSMRGFYKRLDLDESEIEKVAEKLDDKNIAFNLKFIEGNIEGVRVYGNKISYNDLDNIIKEIKGEI